MPSARVLIVDDSVVIRRLITHALETEPDIEVVGTAANGQLALAKIDQLRPDVVTLDIEMPVLDGLATLPALRAAHPRLPVIMCSTLTERGASATLEALALGASDYITKPSSSGGVDAALARMREELLPKIRALCPKLASETGALAPLSAGPANRVAVARTSAPPAPVRAVVIGVSTGGPNALAEVIPSLPAGLGVPVLVCQHMPPVFTRLLAERLDARSALHVREGVDGQPIGRGDVWIAPGGFHMLVRALPGGGAGVQITADPPENSCRPSVDPLLRSASAVFGSGVLAVILTGMGQDGLRGCEDVVATGGRVIVQDEATSVVWGMPGYVARGGLADGILPLDEVAAEIARRAGHVSPVVAASGR